MELVCAQFSSLSCYFLIDPHIPKHLYVFHPSCESKFHTRINQQMELVLYILILMSFRYLGGGQIIMNWMLIGIPQIESAQFLFAWDF
jgi:hypothetical protein